MLLQLLEAEHMLATAPRRRAAPARWTVGSAEMITPHEDDKKVRRSGRGGGEGRREGRRGLDAGGRSAHVLSVSVAGR